MLFRSCVTKSQGAGSWWLVRDPAANKVTLPLLAWEARFEALDRQLESAAEIGVVFSLNSRDRNPRMTDPRANWLRGYYSTCNALSDRHIPYKVLVDQDLTTGKLSDRMRTLILFNTGSMSDGAVEAVRQFVRDGGTLVASSEVSLYDGTAGPEPISDWRMCLGLATRARIPTPAH